MKPGNAARLSFALALALITVSQFVGYEETHFSTLDASIRPTTTPEEATRFIYDISFHTVSWVHGWPWPYLRRQTSFWPANADFNADDASPWAMTRGVTGFNMAALLGDVALGLVLSAELAGIVLVVGRSMMQAPDGRRRRARVKVSDADQRGDKDNHTEARVR
jgi:hypothetical protein